MIALPHPIEKFISAKNARNFSEAASVFSDAAVVLDEGGRHEGRKAIQAWMERASAEYDDQIEPASEVSTNSGTEVTAKVSGTFPGSPATIRFSFTLDGQSIDRLEIR